MMAWNNRTQPGRPEGGEAQAARAIFAAIEKRVGGSGAKAARRG
jgi:leucyl aminopeptidase